jgi:hypothetical protein
MLGSFLTRNLCLLAQRLFAQRWTGLLLLVNVLLLSVPSLADFASIIPIAVLRSTMPSTVSVPLRETTIVLVVVNLPVVVVTVLTINFDVLLSCNLVLLKPDVSVRPLAILSLDVLRTTTRTCFATGTVPPEESKYAVALVWVTMMGLLHPHPPA